MGSSLTPFSRITILLTELNGTKLEDLLDVTKCDLVYHTSKLSEEIEDASHKELASQLTQQAKTLIETIASGDLALAKTKHQSVISACKNLKRLL